MFLSQLIVCEPLKLEVRLWKIWMVKAFGFFLNIGTFKLVMSEMLIFRFYFQKTGLTSLFRLNIENGEKKKKKERKWFSESGNAVRSEREFVGWVSKSNSLL